MVKSKFTIEKKGLDDVIVTQSGAIEGIAEPAIQIHTPDLGLVTYASVKKSDVERILDETVMNGKVIKPSSFGELQDW